jgi:ADP-heptose:LPS heptosyltransferase
MSIELNGKMVCAVSFSSLQEELEHMELPEEERKFCNFMKVSELIQKRIRKCDEELKSKPYILLLPFTMSTSKADRKKLNEDCIIKPIKELEQKFNVFVIYLRKENTKNLTEKDALMKKIDAYFITPDTIKDKDHPKNGCDRSKQLETYIRQKVIQTLP